MGLAVSRFWWPDALVSELTVRRGFHVAAYDQRDSGQSSHFPDTGAASPIAAVLSRSSLAYTAEDMTDERWRSFTPSAGNQPTCSAIRRAGRGSAHRSASFPAGADDHVLSLAAR